MDSVRGNFTEYIDYALSLVTAPEYTETMIHNVCFNFAADAAKCTDTLKTAVEYLLQSTD
ncbi:unnamed protein product [Heterobilharzia americana]|nr:unnamed protein product [Heterobilharzia americana]